MSDILRQFRVCPKAPVNYGRKAASFLASRVAWLEKRRLVSVEQANEISALIRGGDLNSALAKLRHYRKKNKDKAMARKKKAKENALRGAMKRAMVAR